MEHDQRRQHKAVALVATLVLTCVLATAVVARFRPRTFATHQDAIGYVLEQHNIAYTRVLVQRNWPDTVNDRSYGANVSVVLNNAPDVGGRLECATPDGRHCIVVLRELHIAGDAVPELSVGPAWGWPAWVQKLLPK